MSWQLAGIVAPILLFVTGAAMLAGIFGFVVQTGPVWSPAGLKFELKKLSPLSGFNRLFGPDALIQFAKSFIKLIVVAAIGYSVLRPYWVELQQLPAVDVVALLPLSLEILKKLSVLVIGLLLAIAAIDWVIQMQRFMKRQRMTREEVKEEFKQMEGNQEVKGKMRQMARTMAQRRMMQEVPKADVIITNPTHVAVALKYDQKEMASPVVLAKGYDEVAQKIKAIAAEHGIPMVENVQLARALAREVQIGQPIKAKWFKPVAEILAAVYRLRRGAA